MVKPDMHITKTVMTPLQTSVMAEIVAKMEPLQAEVERLRELLGGTPRNAPEHPDIKKSLLDAIAATVPFALIKPALVAVRSRHKYFPEFYGLTPEDVNDTTVQGRSNLAQSIYIKDTDESIQKFVDAIRAEGLI